MRRLVRTSCVQIFLYSLYGEHSALAAPKACRHPPSRASQRGKRLCTTASGGEQNMHAALGPAIFSITATSVGSLMGVYLYLNPNFRSFIRRVMPFVPLPPVPGFSRTESQLVKEDGKVCRSPLAALELCLFNVLSSCVCVCVCVRERERERGVSHADTGPSSYVQDTVQSSI